MEEPLLQDKQANTTIEEVPNNIPVQYWYP